jgi:hypothetical protein
MAKDNIAGVNGMTLRSKIQNSTGKRYMDLDDLIIFFQLNKRMQHELTAEQVYNYLIEIFTDLKAGKA